MVIYIYTYLNIDIFIFFLSFWNLCNICCLSFRVRLKSWELDVTWTWFWAVLFMFGVCWVATHDYTAHTALAAYLLSTRHMTPSADTPQPPNTHTHSTPTTWESNAANALQRFHQTSAPHVFLKRSSDEPHYECPILYLPLLCLLLLLFVLVFLLFALAFFLFFLFFPDVFFLFFPHLRAPLRHRFVWPAWQLGAASPWPIPWLPVAVSRRNARSKENLSC